MPPSRLKKSAPTSTGQSWISWRSGPGNAGASDTNDALRHRISGKHYSPRRRNRGRVSGSKCGWSKAWTAIPAVARASRPRPAHHGSLPGADPPRARRPDALAPPPQGLAAARDGEGLARGFARGPVRQLSLVAGRRADRSCRFWEFSPAIRAATANGSCCWFSTPTTTGRRGEGRTERAGEGVDREGRILPDGGPCQHDRRFPGCALTFQSPRLRALALDFFAGDSPRPQEEADPSAVAEVVD